MSTVVNVSLEQKINEIGRKIFYLIESFKVPFFDKSFLGAKLLDLAMRNEELKIQLFRFVDVLPTLKTNDQLIRHIDEYFGNFKEKQFDILKLASQAASLNIVGKFVVPALIKSTITQMSKTFIAGEKNNEVAKKIMELRKKKCASTIDILGETVLSEKEALHYQNLYFELISQLAVDSKNWDDINLLDKLPVGNDKQSKINVSVKLSSLFSQADSINFQNSVLVLKDRLRTIVKLAKEKNTFICLDMESYFYKDLILQTFKEIFTENEFIIFPYAGIVIQAYLKDSEQDLKSLIHWSKERKTPITIRLVKGAYWDYETLNAKQKNWEPPVFQNKYETDANFEKLASLIIDNYPDVYLAVGSHNIRSIAYAKAYSEIVNLPLNSVEYQFLYGMADSIKEALVNLNEKVRVYMPYGELIPGMAYLVRRLLENTANESFLRQGFVEGKNIEELLKKPICDLQSETCDRKILRSEVSRPGSDFINEPDTDFSKQENREFMKAALKAVKSKFGKKYLLTIGGKKIDTYSWKDSINPSNSHEIIGRFALGTVNDAEYAVKVAKESFIKWEQTSINDRISILKNAAVIMQKKKFELAALMVFEEGKPWREADADVSEAIDFLNYYCSEAKKLFTPLKLSSPAGEENYLLYKPRGVSVIISPWNFPLAILAGMSSASLVCGNTVVLKPAQQASIIAEQYMEILEEAGLPPGVCNYLPGEGKTIGNYLVTHKYVSLIAFTGSMEVGLNINKLASEISQGQQFIKKAICELGGKNAVIIDDDADLDEAVKGAIYSAFGYAGQKCSACSRIIVLNEIYDSFITRLTEAAKSIRTGSACDPASYLGPLIDNSALENARKYIEIGKREGKLICGGNILNLGGYFLEPTIFVDIKPDAQIAQEEIFAPVLAVIKADNFQQAVNIANNVKYGLTGGVFSRSPKNIEYAKNNLNVGNLYLNRACTGAKVARQPFGGFKMSGIGSKSGGKDYLLQFVEPKTITENTMRRGFAPES